MNICVLLIDCLRPDHLGCYGYHKNTSPNIDAIANKSGLFENAYAQSNWTYPSFYSMITSKYPSALNITWFEQKINRDFVVLPEYLAERGYNTALFSPFKVLLNPNAFCSHFKEVKELPMFGDILPTFRDWIKKNDKSFLLLHVPQYVHEPFCADKENVSIFLDNGRNANKQFSETVKCLTSQTTTGNTLREVMGKINKRLVSLTSDDLNYLMACYDAGIYQVDKIVGELYKSIIDEGKEYLFILAADHGQAFFEHGYFGHGNGVYEEVIKVPLIIDYNGAHNFRVSEPVQLMDIFPSLLDILGFENNFNANGSSFADVFKGRNLSNRMAFSEGYPYVCLRNNSHKLISCYSKFWGLKEILNKFSSSKTASWKRNLLSYLLRFKQDTLYDMKTDRKETANIYRRERTISRELTMHVKDILEKIMHESRSAEDAGIDEEIKEQLKSLGYL